MVPIEYTTPSRHPRVVFRAHRMLACWTHPIVPLLRRQWPLPPPTGPSVTLGLSSATYPRFSSLRISSMNIWIGKKIKKKIQHRKGRVIICDPSPGFQVWMLNHSLVLRYGCELLIYYWLATINVRCKSDISYRHFPKKTRKMSPGITEVPRLYDIEYYKLK